MQTELEHNLIKINNQNLDYTFDAIVVGIGHAGIESALSLARLDKKVLALSITLDNAGYLACNPSIGGTAKGHLVREIDALGGEMGKVADKTLTHLRMLNASKGPAVHSLRAQVDKYKYTDTMKDILENTPNLTFRQGEVKELLVENGEVKGVKTTNNLTYLSKSVVLACGVYLESSIIIGDVIEDKGPVGFSRSNYLADSLRKLKIELRRFKTGTPARVHKDSVDLNQLEVQGGEETPYSFSVTSKKVNKLQDDCYLGYTNLDTHQIIKDNLLLSPKYGGLIHGAGARYCPSVEDKIVKFADKERHQFFLEPEGQKTKEMYVQGLSTGLPAEVQLKMYRSVKGFENIQIMRDAYAIEYECINSLNLYASLMSKQYNGLFFAGQINGTSGYEEAAAQGLIAGINASNYIDDKEPLILSRENSYIGVMIDDLVTIGTDEPYRMMTSRAEFRLLLRQDNADLRLTPIGYSQGLVDKQRYNLYLKKVKQIAKCKEIAKTLIPLSELEKYFSEIGEAMPKKSMPISEVVKRNLVTVENFTARFDYFDKIGNAAIFDLFIECKYEGYLIRERRSANEAKRISEMPIDFNTDYRQIKGLRLEAVEKLEKIKPLSIAQASRISGVTPADINVLIIKLARRNNN